MTDHPNLATALAAVQAELPRIGRDNTAQVRSDKGNYSYKYADLAEVSAIVLPLLGRHGLSFTAKPTLTDGRFALEYTLRHASGDSDSGVYPLPASGTAQQVGSAITYARRYVLCAVVGVAPGDDDDDGSAATQAGCYSHERPPQRPEPEQPAHLLARTRLAKTCKDNSWDVGIVAKRYAAQHDGQDLRDATDAGAIDQFRQSLFSVSDSALKPTNGVTAGG